MLAVETGQAEEAFGANLWPDAPWVFGYGSLIWRPGFSYKRAEPAFLRGAHRCLCVYSHRYRGTPEQPGLVFGLKPGGSCHGRAFQVARQDWEAVRAYLWDREMIDKVYKPSVRPITLGNGQTVSALTFLVEPAHARYAGGLAEEDQIRIVREGVGCRGPNLDYVLNTAKHLEDMGIRDRHLHRIRLRLEGM